MSLHTHKNGPVSDINVTPLVDVMLVLLVIFMVTAPLMLNGIQMNLPKTKEVNRVNLTTSQVVLSYTANNRYFLGKKEYSIKHIANAIKEKFKTTSTKVLYLRADANLKYGKVAKLMSLLKRNGISKMALITELKDK